MYLHIKRGLDLLLSLIGLVILSPIFIIIAICIKITSRGSIFFKQDRVGKDGKIFKIFKFRTMIENAENIGDGLFTYADDPRITKVGKIMRNTSLDELPQIINILKGEMSIIGPRPPVPYHPRSYAEYDEFQKRRFSILPGITGLAQVKLRNSAPWDDRIALDVEYVEHMSLGLDCKIFIQTISSVFSRKDISITKEEMNKRVDYYKK